MVDKSAELVCLLREQIKDITKNINQLFFLLNENFLEKPVQPARYAVWRIGFPSKNRYLGCQGTDTGCEDVCGVPRRAAADLPRGVAPGIPSSPADGYRYLNWLFTTDTRTNCGDRLVHDIRR